MNTFFRKCSIAVALVACSCATARTARCAHHEGIDLQEIARRLTEWRNSFVNLRVVWEVRTLPETREGVRDWPPAPAADAGALFCRNEWIWADHGLDLVDGRFFFYQDGNSEAHDVEAFNGPKGVVFRANYRKPAQDAPEALQQLQLLGLGVGKPTSPSIRMPLYGLYWAGSAQWLPELLSEWEWRLDGFEEIGGERCARIEATQPGVPDAEFVEVLWVDLGHDCLVRRYRMMPVPQRRAPWDFIVDEFQRLDAAVWFPKRGRIQLGALGRDGAPVANTNQLFVVKEAAINQPLDLSRFDPPAPAIGTVVVDHGRPYRHGIPAPPDQAASMNGKPTSTVANADPSWFARPPTPKWVFWSAALASASVAFLAFGFWSLHRKKESRL
jgi:hypothetical protein